MPNNRSAVGAHAVGTGNHVLPRSPDTTDMAGTTDATGSRVVGPRRVAGGTTWAGTRPLPAPPDLWFRLCLCIRQPAAAVGHGGAAGRRPWGPSPSSTSLGSWPGLGLGPGSESWSGPGSGSARHGSTRRRGSAAAEATAGVAGPVAAAQAPAQAV